MNWLLGFIIFFSSTPVAHAFYKQPAPPWDTGVLEVAPDALKSHLISNPRSLILYYVTWCPWCRRLFPTWKRLHEFTSDDPSIKCVQVRMDRASPEVQDMYDVKAYPKLVWYEGPGKNTTFEQNRGDFNTLVQWLNEVAGRGTILNVRSMSELQTLLKGGLSQTVAIWMGDQNSTQRFLLPKNTRTHILALKSDDLEIMDYLKKRLAHTPRALDKISALTKANKSFLTLLHPFGNDNSEPNAEMIDVGELGSIEEFNIFEEEEKLEHLPYSKTHIDHSARLWDPVTDVKEFIETYMFPVITKWTADSASRILEVGRPFLVAVTPSKPPESLIEGLLDELGAPSQQSDLYDNELLENVLWEIGTAHRAHMVTAHSNTRSLPERRLLQLLGTDPPSNIGMSEQPLLAYVTLNPTGSGVHAPALKFIAPSKLSDRLFQPRGVIPAESRESTAKEIVKEVEAWLQDIKSARISPTIRSEEPLGHDHNPGPVYHLTALEFQKEVIEAKDIDYFVDFFAPWCGHCRVLAPMLEQAAQAFRQAGYKHVKFGKMDATANEVLGVPIRGYPTLILYPAGPKRSHMPIMPVTPQSVSEIIKFIVKNSERTIDENLVMKQLSRLQPADLPQLDEEL